MQVARVAAFEAGHADPLQDRAPAGALVQCHQGAAQRDDVLHGHARRSHHRHVGLPGAVEQHLAALLFPVAADAGVRHHRADVGQFRFQREADRRLVAEVLHRFFLPDVDAVVAQRGGGHARGVGDAFGERDAPAAQVLHALQRRVGRHDEPDVTAAAHGGDELVGVVAHCPRRVVARSCQHQVVGVALDAVFQHLEVAREEEAQLAVDRAPDVRDQVFVPRHHLERALRARGAFGNRDHPLAGQQLLRAHDPGRGEGGGKNGRAAYEAAPDA
ncbi:MAG: hypothetical protein MUC68_11800 [Burkholderiaceae bacterium]|nr:hypothetical protein [Burkholderiaceae bacterium]